jgi:hypothetical protein
MSELAMREAERIERSLTQKYRSRVYDKGCTVTNVYFLDMLQVSVYTVGLNAVNVTNKER